MKFLAPLCFALALTPLSACRSNAAAEGQHDYTLVFLKTGPNSGRLPAEENKAAFEGHFANMGRLANEGKLLVAGPFGKARHDDSLRGLFVLDCAQRDEARALASTDPTTIAGVFVLEYHDLSSNADFRGALERSLARVAKAKQEDRTPPPGEGARPYVLLTTTQRTTARRELTSLMQGRGVYFLADLDETRLFALLDAQDVAQARERFAKVLERIGEHHLDDWFASSELSKL